MNSAWLLLELSISVYSMCTGQVQSIYTRVVQIVEGQALLTAIVVIVKYMYMYYIEKPHSQYSGVAPMPEALYRLYVLIA